MRSQGLIAALAVALLATPALAGDPRESAPTLTVGPSFLDPGTDTGQQDGGPVFDLNLGRDTLWLDFEEQKFGGRFEGQSLGPPDALLDIYPFDNQLRLTGGMLYDSPLVDSDTRGGALPFTPSTQLSPGSVDWNQYTPYAGVGMQSSFLSGRLEFSVDLGLSYEGNAEVDPTGPSESGSETAAVGTGGDSRQDDAQSLNVLGFSPRAGLSLRFRF